MVNLHETIFRLFNNRKSTVQRTKKDIVNAIIEKDHFEIDTFISEVHLKGNEWHEQPYTVPSNNYWMPI